MACAAWSSDMMKTMFGDFLSAAMALKFSATIPERQMMIQRSSEQAFVFMRNQGGIQARSDRGQLLFAGETLRRRRGLADGFAEILEEKRFADDEIHARQRLAGRLEHLGVGRDHDDGLGGEFALDEARQL